MSAGTTVGISPGTRSVGIAVVKNGALTHWQIRTFPGAWSNKKLRHILQTIGKHVEYNGASSVAVKLPDVFPTEKAYSQLIGSLNIIGKSTGTQIRYYTLKDLKLAHLGTSKANKQALMHILVKRHPELIPEYRKEQQNKEDYYFRMFEAVAVALME